MARHLDKIKSCMNLAKFCKIWQDHARWQELTNMNLAKFLTRFTKVIRKNWQDMSSI